jgi:hypothetical protein
MKLIVPEKKIQGYYLQHQEEEEIGEPSDEEKNVAHKLWVYSRNPKSKTINPVLDFGPFLKILLSHHKGVMIVMFQRQSRATNHTF